MPLLEVLEEELGRFPLQLTQTQVSTLAEYCDELVRWNARMNLTGLHGAELVRRLVVEPVWIATQVKLTGTLADVGSGNGSPAIPVHVVSDLDATHLIEARAKRAVFLRHVVNLLKLKQVTVHRTRVEAAVAELGKVDWVTLQGVAVTRELLDVIKKISLPTTRIVWITSHPQPPIAPAERLVVPSGNTEALIFRLDLT